jgi:hypothetical protein
MVGERRFHPITNALPSNPSGLLQLLILSIALSSRDR